MRCFLNKTIVLVVALLFIVVGCGTDRRDFEKAEKINDISAWEEFLKKYPKSPLVGQAKLRLEELKDFEDAEIADTPEAFEEFIGKHPNSKLVPEAKEQFEKLRQQIAAEQAKVAEIRKLTDQRKFNEAHKKLMECLKQGNREAHFELTRTLLTELRWIWRIWARKAPPTPEDKAAFERERPHHGIIWIGSLSYELRDPYSRQPFTDVTFEISAAWQQFDYIRLIVRELDEYLQVTEHKSPTVPVAKKWLRIIRPIAGKSPYLPYPYGFESVEELTERLGELAQLRRAIDSGGLSVE